MHEFELSIRTRKILINKSQIVENDNIDKLHNYIINQITYSHTYTQLLLN